MALILGDTDLCAIVAGAEQTVDIGSGLSNGLIKLMILLKIQLKLRGGV